MNKAKQNAGRLGGLATVAKHGKEHMRTIGRRGAATTWRRYSIMPVDTSGYALVEKATGKIRAIWCTPWIVLCLALTLTLTSCAAWGFAPVATSTPTPAAAPSAPEPTRTAGTARKMSPMGHILTPTPARCIVSTGYQTGTVNVRGGPGMDYQVVDVVTEGQELPLIGETVNGWQRVTTPALVDGWFYIVRWCKKGR
jgi:general stress protein YciG